MKATKTDLNAALAAWQEAFTPISWWTGEVGCSQPEGLRPMQFVHQVQAERAARFRLYDALQRSK